MKSLKILILSLLALLAGGAVLAAEQPKPESLSAGMNMYVIERDMPGVGEDIAEGRFDAVNEWRRERIWKQASFHSTPELIERATGEKLSASYFKSHLERRYAA